MSVGETYVTVQGRVGGDVEYKDANASKVALASFRLGSTPRYYDRGEGSWADRPTTWFTVECWRTLAENVKSSVQKGQPVLVTGRLKTTEWLDDEGKRQSRTVLDAFSVGHDLTRGTAVFRKTTQVQHNRSATSLDEEMRRLSESAESVELLQEVGLAPAGGSPEVSPAAATAGAVDEEVDEAPDGAGALVGPVPVSGGAAPSGPAEETRSSPSRSRRAA